MYLHIYLLSLLAPMLRAAAQLGPGKDPNLADYETITFANKSVFIKEFGKAKDNAPNPYKDLLYRGFQAVNRKGNMSTEPTIRHTRAVFGSAASVSSNNDDSHSVASFEPESAFFGCVRGSLTGSNYTKTNCIVTVTAFDVTGLSIRPTVDCPYNGEATIKECKFDAAWSEVGCLDFKPTRPGLFGQATDVIGGILSPLVSSLSLQFLMDDLRATYTCKEGYRAAEAGPCSACQYGYFEVGGECVKDGDLPEDQCS